MAAEKLFYYFSGIGESRIVKTNMKLEMELEKSGWIVMYRWDQRHVYISMNLMCRLNQSILSGYAVKQDTGQSEVSAPGSLRSSAIYIGRWLQKTKWNSVHQLKLSLHFVRCSLRTTDVERTRDWCEALAQQMWSSRLTRNRRGDHIKRRWSARGSYMEPM